MISVSKTTNRALFSADTHQILNYLLTVMMITKLTSVSWFLGGFFWVFFCFVFKKYLDFMWAELDHRVNFVPLLLLKQMHSSFFPVYSSECWVQENCSSQIRQMSLYVSTFSNNYINTHTHKKL